MRFKSYTDFNRLYKDLYHRLYNDGYKIKTEKWQGKNTNDSQSMLEVLNTSFSVKIPDNFTDLSIETKSNQPWAYDHLMERLSGEPLNPGNEYKNWPFYKNKRENDTYRTEEEKFTHTYMERIWADKKIEGIRYKYGNISDVVDLLIREPYTRQAYLPIWFPEDTGVLHNGRVPCTLGYHFFIRGGGLHVNYFIRSCDIFRHLPDDIFLASGKVLWILDKIKKENAALSNIKPGFMSMCITSLHCFYIEKNILKRGIK